MNTGELRQRAAELGVLVTYWDWQGHEVTVPDETLAAIVAVLDGTPQPGPGPAPVPGVVPGSARVAEWLSLYR